MRQAAADALPLAVVVATVPRVQRSIGIIGDRIFEILQREHIRLVVMESLAMDVPSSITED